jgi:hypothetical protein
MKAYNLTEQISGGINIGGIILGESPFANGRPQGDRPDVRWDETCIV